ncbi:MAG: PLDc N-terminal domain-containing protein [Candidatus Eremiobacteraeota bacterium]|nr:PLDc N-terminal domain-containing protein [Candidatus Eremiobacteraeota bacterium]
MKLVLEILLAAILHPIAVILMWLDLAGREDLSTTQKIIWAVVGLVWGIGPVLYILVGDGTLW